MQVLVAEDDIASRVQIETALRDRGMSVRNCDDGLEAAKLLSGSNAPRIAVLSNSLKRLRGLDISRVLCAMGKKAGVYVILVCDSLELDLLELCRRAGVDDVLVRPVPPVTLSLRLDCAQRCISQEDELARVQAALRGLGALETVSEKRIKELKEANAALLKTNKQQEPGAAPAATPREAPAQTQRHIRSFDLTPTSAPAPAQQADKPAAAASASAPANAPTSNGAHPEPPPYSAPHLPDVPSAPPPVRDNGVAIPPPPSGHEPMHDEVLSGAEQVQSAELAAEAEDQVIYPFEFDEIMLTVFSGMGVTLKTEIPAKPLGDGPYYVAWVGIGMPGRASWLDVLLVSGEPGAQEVTRALLSEATVSDSDICEMLAELQNMAQGAIRRHMEEGGHTLVQIAIPKAQQLAALPNLPQDKLLVESGFSFNGQPINAMLFEHVSDEARDNLGAAELFDLVCDELKDNDGELIAGCAAGTLVREKQLKGLKAAAGLKMGYRVVRPTPIVNDLGTELLLS